ncbi:uncharacterized protein [Patagioenas fasciata]|uniref:uncharacterized protein n=1 Tax=Patagioenas fasciata TaxID=372321 RepID=UPI003A994387
MGISLRSPEGNWPNPPPSFSLRPPCRHNRVSQGLARIPGAGEGPRDQRRVPGCWEPPAPGDGRSGSPWGCSLQALGCVPQTLTQGLSGAAAPSPVPAQPWVTGQPLCVTVMSPVHHKRGPYLSGFRGGSGVTLTAREPVSKRASEMGKCVENTSEMERKAKAQRPQRRFRCCVRNMGDWQLILLIFIFFLTVWVLCNILLPRIITSLGSMGVSIYMARRASNIKAKGTCVRKRLKSSRGTDPMGKQPRPRAALVKTAAPGQGSPSQPERCESKEVSAESSRSGQCIPQQGESWRSSCDGEAASARELPQETENKAPGGRSHADSSSELPRNQHSIGNMEELSKSLMDSLDMTKVCHDLMEEPKATSQKSATPALHKSKSREYLVCLQCRRCVTSSCPHCSEPQEQQDLPMLVVFLHGYYLVVAKGQVVEMKLELKFELVIGGKPVYTWEKDQLLGQRSHADRDEPISLSGSKSSKAPYAVLRTPQGQMGLDGQDIRASPEQQPCTKRGGAGSADRQPAGQGGSLPSTVSTRSSRPGDSETSQVSCPILSTQGTPEGQTGLAKKDTRAAPDLQPAGQGEPLPNTLPTYLWPAWAQPPTPVALERLRRAALEPLPAVGFKGLEPGFSRQQRIRYSWANVKRRLRAALKYFCIAGNSEPTDAMEWEQMVRLDLQRRADALLHITEVVV